MRVALHRMNETGEATRVEGQSTAADIESFNKHKTILEKKLALQKTRLEETKITVANQIKEAKDRFASQPELLNDMLSRISASEYIAQRGVDKTASMLNFLRPRNKKDLDERIWAHDHLATDIQQNIPEGLPLRFHGAPIYYAEQIIKTGGLSSSEDRLGTTTSYDVAGQVSVTTPEGCSYSIQGFTDTTAEGGNLPSGCIFVLIPRSEEEAKLGETSLMMGNIDFKKENESLFGVITSEENKERVKGWLRGAELNENIVSTFNEFPQKLAELKKDIETSPEVLDKLVPYRTSNQNPQ